MQTSKLRVVGRDLGKVFDKARCSVIAEMRNFAANNVTGIINLARTALEARR